MNFGGVGFSTARIFRNLTRATRGPRRGRRRRITDTRPCGPKLTRGRGWKRRRKHTLSALRFLGYLLLAGIVFLLAMEFVSLVFAAR